MGNKKYIVMIDFQEFQKRILDLITTEEIDNYFNCTIFCRERRSSII